MNIKDRRDLVGYTLKFGDTVTFKFYDETLKYWVSTTHLSTNTTVSNKAIFRKIGVIPSDFCRIHYGYSSHGDWPIVKGGDYETLTRVVIEIYNKMAVTPQGDSKITFNFINNS